MKIIDTFMYFNEDMILDLRLHTLDKYVSKFIICEAKFNHNGKPKKLNFDINRFKKFKDKIEYVVVEKQPTDLSIINKEDSGKIKRNKILDNALKRENYQRNFVFKELKKFSEDDLVMINDLDEIPNLENFSYKRKITIFKQKMFYYKLNLQYPNFDWMGSKVCKIKHLISPQWLRNIKSKKYPIWRIDILFDNKRYSNLEFVETGGWHFTNVMSAEEMDYKMRNFLHHLEYEESGYDLDKLKSLINNRKVMYDHKADKKNLNKWVESITLEKVGIDLLPKYISVNKKKFEIWID